MRVLHAVHDFLPRHRAGSEIYAFDLAREQQARGHTVFVVAAEYDPSTAHGTIRWREHGGLTVIELVNNWQFTRFEDTYASERVTAQLRHVLDATQPDVLHLHNLLNLSFDLPRVAKERGIAVVATLHDYTLVCASGGQRVHVAEAHVCDTIDPERCARCFTESAFAGQMLVGNLTRGRVGRMLGRSALAARRWFPEVTSSVSGTIHGPVVDAADIRRRLSSARHVLHTIDLLVAPSRALADEFVRLGAPPDRMRISDYGFVPIPVEPKPARSAAEPLRIGFVGTLVWHKGAHVLLDAAALLERAFEVHVHGDLSVFPDYAARLRHAAAAAPVTFHGGFGRDRVQDIYASLDVIVVASLWPENSPLVIHEAFMAGVPVVGSRTGGIPGLITHGVNGLLYETFSVESLRHCLQELIDDRELLAAFAARAPAVKTMVADANEWDGRYEQARERHASSSAAVVS